MSMFLNFSHSPTLVMLKGDGGTSSPVKGTQKSVLIWHMMKVII